MIVTLTKDNFEAEVLRHKGTVLVDFWATWCGPCKMIAPFVEAIAQEREDVKVGKIDVDTQPELAIRYKIMSIPTLLVFKDGQLAEKAIGLRSKEQIEGML